MTWRGAADSGRLPAFAAAALLTLCCAPALAAAPSVALSPLNGTPDASPTTQISFLGVPSSEISHISVVGSHSGSHSGKLESYVSAPGASFLPYRAFSQGESVKVSALVGPAGHTAKVTSTFKVADLPDYTVVDSPPQQLSGHGQVQTFHSQPHLLAPAVTVSANSPAAAAGDIFLTPTNGYGQSGAMIFGPQGDLVWFHPVPKGDNAEDLQVQSYRGQPVLTWWEGDVSARLGVGFGRDEIVSTAYKPIATVDAGNGYQADLHEFQLTPGGSAFTTAYTLVSANLSSVGGSSHGILEDAVLQEIDVPTGLVMFEWHAYGHVSLSDSYYPPPHESYNAWDFFHMNSVSLDPSGDGNFVISSRNTWTAYEINHLTGAVEWRLGGRHSSFKMGPGTGTAWQHDVQWQPDGSLTIFDNGATPKQHSVSRAIRERINFQARTVALVSRYSDGFLSGSQGDNQLLANGNTFVGWGERPDVTEFAPSGQIVYAASFAAPGESYRAYRATWNAAPASLPAIAVGSVTASSATVYASWNGATEVASWQVLGGPSSSSLAPLAGSATTGFETSLTLTGAPVYVAVRALGAAGQVLGTSAAVKR